MRRILFDVLEVNIAVSIVILLVCLLEKKLYKRYGAGWLKIVWFVLAVRLLIPYNLSLPFTELRFFNVPRFEQEETSFFVPNQETQGRVSMGVEGVLGMEINENMAQGSLLSSTPDIVQDSQLSSAQNVVQDNQLSSTQNVTQKTGMPGQLAVAPTISQSNHVPSLQSKYGASAHNPSESEGNRGMVVSYSTILVLVWLLGIGVGIMYFVLSNISFYITCKKTLQPIAESALLKNIGILQERMLGKVRLAVYQSSVINSPMLVGLVNPKLVLPVHKQEWQTKELEYIVAHELCHYRNKDLWLKLLIMVAWCLNWFNPLVLLMKKKCFFHIELACDGCVLEGMESTVRREYAGMLISFAGKRQEVSAFSTNFGDNKKRMKQRIDYALDTHTRKKGIGSLLVVVLSMIVMCFLISCGYKPDEVEAGGLEPSQNQMANSLQSEQQTEQIPEPVETGTENNTEYQTKFSYNHEYNEMIRYYEGYIYFVKVDGIYRIKEGTVEEQVFSNTYIYRRGMELHKNFLYFCGSVQRGEQQTATVYRMDLNSLEVVDTLAMFNQTYEALYAISIYEDCLYVSNDTAVKLGFQLNEAGDVVNRLDGNAEDFLYREYNDYVNLQVMAWNEKVYDFEEYLALIERQQEYLPLAIDFVACQELLGGKQVVEVYKDEGMNTLYLKHADGTLEYLCDKASGYFELVTETGVYYAADLRGNIYYVDYETKMPRMLVDITRDASEIWLINYDEEYVYYAKSPAWEDEESGDSLMRVSRQGGESEVAYQFGKDFNAAGLYQNCAIVDDYLYFDEKWVRLNPPIVEEQKEPSIEAITSNMSKEAPSKEEVLSMRSRVLEGMSEAEIERLRENIKVANLRMENAYFYDYLFERLTDSDDMYWNYFEQKGDIQIGWTEADGPIMVYNRFDADNFIALMLEMQDSLKSDLLKADFDSLIENTELARGTHDVEYVKQIYRMLHDMDYFLLRYGPEDVGRYTKDSSTVSKYYGVLEIYNEEG